MNFVLGLKIVFFAFITNVSSSYTLHSIRFVHIGIEQKPIGTLVMSVEKTITPNDREMDGIFGKCVKTDMRTFETVVHFAERSKHLVSRKSNKSDYRIIINNKNDFYLESKNRQIFFEELRVVLTKEKCDKLVIDALKNKPN